MPVYVDQAQNKYGRMVMCHMIADTPEELHQMAAKIGMRRSWFQPTSFPHYDVAKFRREKAIEHGALVISRRDLVLKMREIRRRGLDGTPADHGDWRQTWTQYGS